MAAVEEASYNKEYQVFVESIVKGVKFQKPQDRTCRYSMERKIK